jgi:hypothetical protein
VLSIARCRELLGHDCSLNDEQLEALRDQMYELAKIALDAGSIRRDDGEGLRREASRSVPTS